MKQIVRLFLEKLHLRTLSPDLKEKEGGHAGYEEYTADKGPQCAGVPADFYERHRKGLKPYCLYIDAESAVERRAVRSYDVTFESDPFFKIAYPCAPVADIS